MVELRGYPARWMGEFETCGNKSKMRGQLELTPTYAAQMNGKILGNAHAVGDVDGDGATELLFGSLTGTVAVFKIMGGRLAQWRRCEVDGSVTSICLDSSIAGDTRIVVATAEGTCSVFRSVDGVDVLQLCSEFTVALNICDVVQLNGELLIGTCDGRVFVYSNNIDGSAGYTQFAQFEIAGEIESLLVLQEASPDSDGSPQLLVRCISGEVFRVSGSHAGGAPDKRDIVLWNNAIHDHDDVTFVVCDVELGGQRGMSAHASITGLLSLFSSSWERQWDVQLPEAVVSADKLEMSETATGDRQDAIVVCTWSGQLYAIQSERRLVRFRMLQPASSMFCVGIRDGSGQSDPTVVGISTSGTIYVFRDVQETLVRGLQDSTLADKVRQSALFERMDTPDKRQAIMEKLRSTFPSSASAASMKMPSSPTVEELIRAMLATPVEA